MQNSGVCWKEDISSYSSRKDKNPRLGIATYYGVLKYIIEIHYGIEKKLVIF
ncbi:hypothetical protein Scep_001681 [Stephania cephalantha]|uniref:Uncharacterized protein n=1 Tax=Stephania cephalantha TaxID=152367 RepID=A0AAP0L9J1_9MAGN